MNLELIPFQKGMGCQRNEQHHIRQFVDFWLLRRCTEMCRCYRARAIKERYAEDSKRIRGPPEESIRHFSRLFYCYGTDQDRFLWASSHYANISFFSRNRVLKLSSGIDDMGEIVWELSLCLLISWLLCYFIIWKGTQSSSRIVYITATAPYIMLFILFIRGVTLDGAVDGIIYYIYPDFTRLSESEVWMDAGTQIFFSYAICTSTIVCILLSSTVNASIAWSSCSA